MKYIKTYETKISQKSLIEALNTFFVNSLPDNFTIKLYSGTLNIQDINIKKNNVGYVYVQGTQKSEFDIHLSCRTIESPDFNIVAKYIIDKLKDYNIPIKIDYKDKPWLYNEQYIITFRSEFFEDIINMLNDLTDAKEDLSILMSANKYNL